MERLHLAELMAALSLATDLGMGQPLEQALRTCLIAIELAERMGLAKDEISEVFYVALLRFISCTVDAHELAKIFGGDDIAARRASAPVVGGSGRGRRLGRLLPIIFDAALRCDGHARPAAGIAQSQACPPGAGATPTVFENPNGLAFFPPSFHLRGHLLPPGFPGPRNDRNRPRGAGFESASRRGTTSSDAEQSNRHSDEL